MTGIKYTIDNASFTDRIHIDTHDGLSLCLIKTDEGYILDTYAESGELITSGTFWKDDYKDNKDTEED